jgi:hypothetical protein
MTNRFLLALVGLSSFLEVTFPTGAIAFPVAPLAIRSTDATGALIPVRKGKGRGDREERFEPRHHHEAYGISHLRRHTHGLRRFNGNQGFGNYSGFGGNQNQPNGQN